MGELQGRFCAAECSGPGEAQRAPDWPAHVGLKRKGNRRGPMSSIKAGPRGMATAGRLEGRTGCTPERTRSSPRRTMSGCGRRWSSRLSVRRWRSTGRADRPAPPPRGAAIGTLATPRCSCLWCPWHAGLSAGDLATAVAGWPGPLRQVVAVSGARLHAMVRVGHQDAHLGRA